MCPMYVPNYILDTYVLNCITIFMIAILYVFYIFDIYFATLIMKYVTKSCNSLILCQLNCSTCTGFSQCKALSVGTGAATTTATATGAASAERGLNSTTRLALISSKWTSGSSCRTRTMDTFGQGGGPKKYAMLLCKFNCTIRARQGECKAGQESDRGSEGRGGEQGGRGHTRL